MVDVLSFYIVLCPERLTIPYLQEYVVDHPISCFGGLIVFIVVCFIVLARYLGAPEVGGSGGGGYVTVARGGPYPKAD
jgi:hypothetical protein